MDLRFAWRAMMRNPGFAALVIATMALGIGANTTMFAVIRAVFLRPLPFPDQDRVVTLWESDPEKNVERRRVMPANFVDWEAQATVFEDIGTLPNWTGPAWPINIAGKDGIERVEGIYASSGFFRTLGVPPLIGRTFGREEDRRRGERKVVISYSYWKERFAGDLSILGKTIDVDFFRGGKFTIIGVMPAGFDFPHNARIWLSLGDWGAGPMPPPDAADRCCSWYTVFAKLKPGITAERAASELTAIARRISERHPQSARVSEVKVVPLRESLVGTHRLALFTLLGAVGCVLLIGCANVANLLLSRGVGRRREILTRMALGATPWRVARQLVLESLLLCGLGAIGGLLVAVWSQKVLARVLAERVPLVEATRLDWAVLGFAALLTLLSGVICGLAPLAGQAIDWRSRGHTEGPTRKRLRQALVVGEVALAVLLVATAGLLLRTVVNLQSVDVGFRIEKVLVISMDVTTSALRERGNAARFIEALMPRVTALPGVRLAGATTGLPFEGGPAGQAITREDRPVRLSTESPQVVQGAATPGYFAAMGIALKKGRLVQETDTAGGKLVAVLNETAARRYWPGEDPIGKRFAVGSLERFGSFRQVPRGEVAEWREIVGVVADVRSAGFGTDIQPQVYYGYKQFPLYDPKLVVRTAGDPRALASALRREISAVNPNAVVTRVRTMEEVAAASIAEPRFRAALVGLFSGLALALAWFGIYGVLSYTVAQRNQEIAIRMALGARCGQVAGMIVAQALRMTLAGVALGLLGAFTTSRWISTLLFGVRPADAATLAVTCLLLAGAAVLAGYVPARNAVRIDPAAALRSE